jgi:anaerobic magnesium-protoporphyrin IX monomethyl ester cyclase
LASQDVSILFINMDRVGFSRIGVMYLLAGLQRKGFSVAIAHACDGMHTVEKTISNFSPRIIAYSIMTGEHVKALEFNRLLKKHHDFLAVFGGPHPTFFLPMIQEEGCDAICIGEGDLAFPEFCERVREDSDYWNAPNFMVKLGDRTYANDILPLVADLDQLPDPDRDLTYREDKYLWEDVVKPFFSTRGCPYKCTYCFNNKYNTLYQGKGKIMRHRSPERLIEEILAVKAKYPMEIVGFGDDSFLSQPKQWFEVFCDLYMREVNLPFTCTVRANLVEYGRLAKLRDAGLSTVWMGVECGNEDIANRVLHRNLSNSQLLEAARIIKGLGIKLVTQNLTGLPTPNPLDVDLETIDLNIRLKPDFAWSSILLPYPGTPVADYAQEHGFIDVERLEYTETNKRYSSLKLPPGEKAQVEHLHKLFGIIVNFPWLRPFARTLVRLPLSRLYLFLFYAWYGYCLKIKTKPNVRPLAELARNLGLMIRMLRKS